MAKKALLPRAPTKQKQFKLPKLEAVVAFPRGAELDRKYMRSGQPCWVTGYRVFDPDVIIYGSGKASKIRESSGSVLVVHGDRQKPVKLSFEQVRLHQPGTTLTFSDVFGSAGSGGTYLTGLEAAEKEDLAIGLAEIPVE